MARGKKAAGKTASAKLVGKKAASTKSAPPAAEDDAPARRELAKAPKPKAPPSLDTFLVQHVVLHDMPKVKLADKDATKFRATLAEAPIGLDDDLRRFFRQRITNSLKRQSFDAVYDPPEAPDSGSLPDATSRVPQLVVDFFDSNGDDLVEVSRSMALELYGRQTGSTSPGMLAVIEAVIGSGANQGKCLVILKLEDDHALLVDPAETVDGKRTYDASVRAVTMPEEAKVFKAALFGRTDSLSALGARVSDNQRDADTYGKEVSEFFLKFLGCQLRVTADRVTLEYAERALAWANSIDDEEKQADYTNAILADINSPSTTIKPADVAQMLQPEDRDSFLEQFRHQDGSLPELTKDRTLTGSRTENVIYEFGNSIKVWGPQEAMKELVRQEQGTWVIDSTLKKSGPTGRR